MTTPVRRFFRVTPAVLLLQLDGAFGRFDVCVAVFFVCFTIFLLRLSKLELTFFFFFT